MRKGEISYEFQSKEDYKGHDATEKTFSSPSQPSSFDTARHASGSGRPYAPEGLAAVSRMAGEVLQPTPGQEGTATVDGHELIHQYAQQ